LGAQQARATIASMHLRRGQRRWRRWWMRRLVGGAVDGAFVDVAEAAARASARRALRGSMRVWHSAAAELHVATNAALASAATYAPPFDADPADKAEPAEEAAESAGAADGTAPAVRGHADVGDGGAARVRTSPAAMLMAKGEQRRQ
jgi:hypothetical protein